MFQGQTLQPGTIFGENKVGERRLVEQGFSQTDSNGNFTSTPSGGQQMIMRPLSIDEQMNSPNYQGLLKRREESGGQDADAQRQLDLLQSNFKKQYIPVPPGQVFQKATYGTPTPNFSRPFNVEDKKFGIVESRIGQAAPPQQFEYDGPGPSMGYQLRTMAQPSQPAQQLGGMFNQPQQRGGMFGQQNQFNQQGMQQMMQFMQQMMQMFSMMGGQNRGGGFGGGFGGQQQYQQPQRYQPQPRQQYQPPPRQQFQPVQQQYGQMGPQQPSPFAQSIRPRY